jgi:nucleoside-diphosphate-sugar epimerase
MPKIAILGASGHIGRNLVWYFSQEKQYDLVLFSRNHNNLKNTIKSFCREDMLVDNYTNFGRHDHDVIINCVGTSDPKEIQKQRSSIMLTSENYDNQVIEYMKKHGNSMYINMSSGSVYGHKFINPVDDSSYCELDLNNPNPGLFYSVAKLYSEIKHRSLTDLNIVDLRIFGFFSRFIDLKATFFMSELVSAIKYKEKFLTSPVNFVRDFVHPHDLFLLVQKCMNKVTINNTFDVFSKAPISKFEIIDSLSKLYDLKHEIREDKTFYSPTDIKQNYYSLSRKAEILGYSPKYSSLETITDEIKDILG